MRFVGPLCCAVLVAFGCSEPDDAAEDAAPSFFRVTIVAGEADLEGRAATVEGVPMTPLGDGRVSASLLFDDYDSARRQQTVDIVVSEADASATTYVLSLLLCEQIYCEGTLCQYGDALLEETVTIRVQGSTIDWQCLACSGSEGLLNGCA